MKLESGSHLGCLGIETLVWLQFIEWDRIEAHGQQLAVEPIYVRLEAGDIYSATVWGTHRRSVSRGCSIHRLKTGTPALDSHLLWAEHRFFESVVPYFSALGAVFFCGEESRVRMSDVHLSTSPCAVTMSTREWQAVVDRRQQGRCL